MLWREWPNCWIGSPPPPAFPPTATVEARIRVAHIVAVRPRDSPRWRRPTPGARPLQTRRECCLLCFGKKVKKSNGCTLAEENCVTSNQLRERKKCIAALAWSSSAPWKIKYFANLFCGLFLVEGGLEVQKQICWLVVAAAAAKTSSKAKTGSSSKLRMTIVLFFANLNLQINFAYKA